MILYAGIINVFLVEMVSLQSLNERIERDTACFGTGDQSLIDANCSSTENLYPIGLYAGAKLSTSACPLEMESNATDGLVQQCCIPATNQDCVALVNTYVPAIASDYLETCVGRTACLRRQASRMDVLSIIECNSTVYPSQTHYMYLDYQCVPESNIGRFPSVDLTNDGAGSLLYLQGSTYPFLTSSTSMTCSVETDCLSTVEIYGLHVNFQQDNGTCNQALMLNDTSGTLYTIDCADNADNASYKLRSLANSYDNYIEVFYSSLYANQGLFWLAFKVTGNLTINCPRKDPINECLTTTPITTTTTTTTESTTTTPETSTTTTPEITTTTTPEITTTTTLEITTTTTPEITTTTTPETTEKTATANVTTGIKPPSTEASTADTDSTMVIIIVVVIVIVLLLICAAVLIIRWYKKNKNARDNETEEDEKDMELGQDNECTVITSDIQNQAEITPETDMKSQNFTTINDIQTYQNIGPVMQTKLPSLTLTTDEGHQSSALKSKTFTDSSFKLQDDEIKQNAANTAEGDGQKKRKKKKKRKTKPCTENLDDAPQSNPVNILSTEETGREKRKKKKKKRKESGNQIAPDFYPITNVMACEQETALSYHVDDQQDQDNQPNEKKTRKKKRTKRKKKDVVENDIEESIDIKENIGGDQASVIYD